MTAVTIAEVFAAIVREWLTAAEFAEMRRLNAAETEPNVCHSHDYCDANIAMDEAFRRVLGRGPLDDGARDPVDDGMTAANVALWNEAFSIATREHLGAPRIL